MGKSEFEKIAGISSANPLHSIYPYFFNGIVVHGFGRGSRQLGCPTANLDEIAVSKLPTELPCGVFYGFAQVDNGKLYEMVMSIGWNPQFKNEKKTIEVHILHEFQDDFYGSRLSGVALGYLRDMQKFNSIDELKEAISNDISLAKKKLSFLDMKAYENNEHFGEFYSCS